MNGYIKNRDCACVRCRAHSLMGAAILIALGVIFMIDHTAHNGRAFPILLLVIGGMLMLQRTGSTEGHVNPGWTAGQVPPLQQYPQQSPPQQWTNSGNTAPPPPPLDPNDPQVKP